MANISGVVGEGELVVMGTRYRAVIKDAILCIIHRPSGLQTIFFELHGEQKSDDGYDIAIRVTLETRPLAGVLPTDLSTLDIERKSWTDLDDDEPVYDGGGTFYANAEHGVPTDVRLKFLHRKSDSARATFEIANEDGRLKLSAEINVTVEILSVPSVTQRALKTNTLDLTDWDIGPGDLDELPETDRIRIVKLGYNKRLTDTGLTPLSRLKGVEELVLHQNPLVGEGLNAIAGWSSLRKINLFASDIVDAACEPLAKLTSLEWLDIRSTKITGTGFAKLGNLRKLTHVLIGGAQVDAKGFAALRGAPELIYLAIDMSTAGDDAIAALGVLPKLTQLDIGRTQITDAAFPIMAQNFPALRHIEASYSKFSDAALNAAAQMQSLAHISVHDAATTPAGRARLRAARPGIMVIPVD